MAFQGGGARGVSHIGGLAAVNALDLEIEGVAGTSAGAIMAALVAAHYRAEQLLDPKNKTHLLKVVRKGHYKMATELFTRKGWRAIWCLRGAARVTGWITGQLAEFGVPDALGWLWRRVWGKVVLLAAGSAIALALDYFVPRFSLIALVVTVGGLGWAVLRCLSGLATLDEVRALVDEAIGEGLNTSDRGITFEQLDALGGLPLKLVATNISTQSLELFSLDTTPTAKVADAVAASICLPVAFKPWSFSFARKADDEAVERCFIDGGLVSNLPVWTFDEERSLRPDAVTIAFGLMSQKSTSGTPHWLPAALHTVVAGPPQVHFRGIERMIHIPLPSAISVLDFDASFETLAQNVEQAEAVAKVHLERNLTEVPAAMRRTLQDMQTNISRELSKRFPREFDYNEPAAPLVRIALAIQKPGDHISLAIAYEVGHAETRRGTRFSFGSSPVGSAWTEDQPGYYIFGSEPDKKQIYGDSAWTALFPIIDTYEPVYEMGSDKSAVELAVVAIVDSATPLPDTILNNETLLEDFWLTLADAAFDFFDENKVARLFRRSIAWL